MRPDVKLGVAISLVVVLVAGGYYLYRDTREEPIPMAGGRFTGHGKQVDDRRARVEQPAPPGPRAVTKSIKSKPAAEPQDKPGARPTGRRGTPRIAKRPSTRKSARPTATTRPMADTNTKIAVAQGPDATKQTRPKGIQRTRPGSRAASQEGKTRASSGAGSLANLAQKNVESPPGSATRHQPRRGAGTAARKAASQKSASAQGKRGFDGTASQPSKGKPASVVSAPSVRPDVAAETHRVQPGDTFASLAVAYYGHEKYTRFLIDSNPQIEDPRRLRIGSRIKIPPVPPAEKLSLSNEPAPRAAPVDKDAAGRRTYRVKPGDSFYRIARNVLADASRWEEVFALNKELVGSDPKKLQVGQVLTLPDP